MVPSQRVTPRQTSTSTHLPAGPADKQLEAARHLTDLLYEAPEGRRIVPAPFIFDIEGLHPANLANHADMAIATAGATGLPRHVILPALAKDTLAKFKRIVNDYARNDPGNPW